MDVEKKNTAAAVKEVEELQQELLVLRNTGEKGVEAGVSFVGRSEKGVKAGVGFGGAGFKKSKAEEEIGAREGVLREERLRKEMVDDLRRRERR